MKYGTFRFIESVVEQRENRPDMEKLPPKCCANCGEWGEFSDKCGAGTCFHHSCYAPDGDSVFTWADDLCKDHEPLESEE